MTAKELIESGVIELYCLGIASEEEKLLVEQLAETDHLLKDEISSINDALAMYAVTLSSVAPPKRLKQAILSAIRSSDVEDAVNNFPPKLTSNSTVKEWIEYMAAHQIESKGQVEGVTMIELPGSEDYYTYIVFGKPGDSVEEEIHTGHDEYLLICEGECEMTIGGRKSFHKAGDFFAITPGIPHSAIVTGTDRMIVIGQRRAA